jgi:hypothetical protein
LFRRLDSMLVEKNRSIAGRIRDHGFHSMGREETV